MIELYLSSDGKHTVHVSAEAPAKMNELAPYAQALYQKILEKFGTKPELWEAAKNGNAKAPALAETPRAAAPHCPEHDKPMKYRKGRYGDFWSCPTKAADGTWCTYTQEVPKATNGHRAPAFA